MKNKSILFIAVIGISFLIGIDRWNVNSWREEMAAELAAASRFYHSRMEDAIAQRLNAVENLVALFVMHPDTRLKEFEIFSDHIIKTNRTIRTLQFADSNTLITYTFPSKGNEIVIKEPLMLINDPKRGPYVRKAIFQKSASVQGPFNLRQGGSGIVVRSPIFIEEQFIGLAIGIYDIDTLIGAAFFGIDFDKFSFRLTDSTGWVFHGQNSEFDSEQDKKVQVGDTYWTMTIGRIEGATTAPLAVRLMIWGCGIGFLLSIILLIKTSAEQNIQLEHKVEERTSRLSEVNKSLSIEIADRKSAEKKLSESEERYYLALDASQDGLYDWNLETNDIFYSKGWKKMLGYEDHEISNVLSEWERLTRQKDVEASWTMLNDILDGRRDRFEIEFQMLHKDGHWVDILSRANIIFNDEGKRVRVVGTHVDISQRKKMELDLRESEERFRAIYEHAPVLIDAFDENGRCLLWNNECQKTFGWSIEEINAHGDALSLFYPDPAIRKEVIRSVTSEPDVQFREWHPVTKDGKIIDTMWANFRLPDGLTFNLGYDITERKKAEAEKLNLQEQLVQAQKMESIGNLAGGIAHDFNNILSSIIGFTELSLDETSKGTTLDDNLQEVYSAGIRAKELVKQILAFARQSDEKRSPIRLSSITKEVLQFIRSTVPTTIEIRKEIESDTLIMANATQIHQVLMNLCTNAAHAMDENGGLLKVSLRDVMLDKADLSMGMRPGDYIEIKVSDTGDGIPQEIIGSIFEPYFTTKGPGEGTGMGLAMAHGIIESYGGKITVNSQLGKGTTFSISLPATRNRKAIGEYVSEQLPTGSERILFVDDEASITKMGSQLLERLGYSVTTQTSSVEALGLFRTRHEEFDLVVTDMTMPNMTGDNLAIELIKIRPDVPVILCTGYSKKISDEKASEIGIKAFAYKPIVKADLAKTIRNILDEAHSGKDSLF